MNTFYELGSGVTSLIECARRNDEESSGVTVRRLKDLVRKMDGKLVYSPMQMNIVFSELLRLPLDTSDDLGVQADVVRNIRTIYGENNIVLGDLCKHCIKRRYHHKISDVNLACI